MACQLLKAREFAHLATVAGLSRPTLDEHYQLYLGFVHKANSLTEKICERQRTRGALDMSDIANLKGDLQFALAAVRNHEIYFDLLGHQTVPLHQELADCIDEAFDSTEGFLLDLRMTAVSSRGWVWTVYDLTTGRIWNLSGSQNGQFPLFNAVPILALDLSDHAYFYDFGLRRGAYVDVVLAHLRWDRVWRNLQSAQALRNAVGNSPDAAAPLALAR